MPENSALGINIFCFGTLDPEGMVQQKQWHRQADSLYHGNAAPTLMDIVALQDTKQDVYIPRTFPQLRYLNERSEELLQVLLGSQRPLTTAYREYRDYLSSHEHLIERITTNDSRMLFMVPALLARRVQLATNAWL